MKEVAITLRLRPDGLWNVYAFYGEDVLHEAVSESAAPGPAAQAALRALHERVCPSLAIPSKPGRGRPSPLKLVPMSSGDPQPR